MLALLIWLVWIIWVVLAGVITWPAFLWEVNYFHSPGPGFFRAVVILLISLPVLLAAWHALRRRMWKFELVALVGIPVAGCLVYETGAALVLGVTWVACYASGRRLHRFLGISTTGPVEDIAISTLAGLGILSVALFWIGTFGGYYWFVFVALLVGMLLAGWAETPALWNSFRELHRRWASMGNLAHVSGSVWSAFAFALTIAASMFALAPTLTFDVLRFHLPAAQYFAATHALRAPDYLSYANYPQSVETAMTLAFELAGQPGAQLIPALYLAVGLLLLFRLGRLSGLDRFQALTGLLFTASVPAVHWTGASGKNDFAMVAFLLGALLAYLRWMETRIFNWLILGVFFAALAAGVKHIVVFAAPPLVVLYAAAAWRQPDRSKALLKLATPVLACGLVWYARTWMATGQLVYPATAGTAVSTAVKLHKSVWQDLILPYLCLPWDLHFHSRGYFESVSDYSMGLLLLLFAPSWLLLARTRLNRAARVCLFFSGAYLVYWAIAMPVIRYGIAALSIVLMLTAGFAIQLCRILPQWVRFVTLAMAVYGLTFASLGIAINELNGPQLRYFAFRIDRTEYLRQALLPYRALEFLKTQIAPGDRTLSVDNCALAYAPNQSGFECLLVDSGTWWEVRKTIFVPHYRFLIMPVAQRDAVPQGWKSIYDDHAFLVYQHE